jgi:subtilase family serine protease
MAMKTTKFAFPLAVMAISLMPFGRVLASQVLRDEVPPVIENLHLQPISLLPATNRLDLAISLPLRNQAALNTLLSEIYNPASTNYHRYLTPEQFTERFGPTEQDYQTLINFARTNGLTVTTTHPNRALLDVSGNVATIERVFHVTLRVYRHPTENRTFYAPDREPSVDFDIPILHVAGLDNFELPHPVSNRNAPP